MSAVIICGIVASLVAAVYNINAYLYKLRLNKCLINAFYVTLVIMLLANILQWCCSLAHPAFYAAFFLSNGSAF